MGISLGTVCPFSGLAPCKWGSENERKMTQVFRPMCPCGRPEETPDFWLWPRPVLASVDNWEMKQ